MAGYVYPYMYTGAWGRTNYTEFSRGAARHSGSDISLEAGSKCPLCVIFHKSLTSLSCFLVGTTGYNELYT